MVKRIAAWIGIGVIGVMFLLSAIAAATARPEANGLFMASMVSLVFVPVLLWIFIKLYEWAHRNDGITRKEMKEIEKRIAAGENPEDIAKEIEEKYGK